VSVGGIGKNVGMVKKMGKNGSGKGGGNNPFSSIWFGPESEGGRMGNPLGKPLKDTGGGGPGQLRQEFLEM